MPLKFIQLLMSKQRSRKTNLQLGAYMAFVAGAVNAGGFLAITRYTSHMSGIIAGISDDLALSDILSVLGGVALLLAFLGGAATTAVIVHWGQRRKIYSQFALPLFLEATLLLFFGLVGANLNLYLPLTVPAVALLLCFVMGLQNAILTKASQSEIRTTHMTGVITDIGIELGKLFYWNTSNSASPESFVKADRAKLRALLTLCGMFFIGGIIGAISFKSVGYISVVPLSLSMLLIASLQVYRDVRVLLKSKIARLL